MNTVCMFFCVQLKMPFRFLKRREMTAARFAGFGIHAPTMVEPKRDSPRENSSLFFGGSVISFIYLIQIVPEFSVQKC